MSKASEDSWSPDEWDGMSEEDALDGVFDEVMDRYGKQIATQNWAGGSWVAVYEYRGRFFVVDEVERSEFSNVEDAFERAGIGRAVYDEIRDQHVSPDYAHLVKS